MNGRVVMGVTVGLVVGVVAGWLGGGADTSDLERVEEQLVAVALERDAVAVEKADAMSNLETAERRLGRLDRELGAARAALAAADAARAAESAAAFADEVDAGEPDERGASALGQGQTFSFPEYDEHLAAIDWTDVGTHVGAMAPLLVELMDSVSKGERPSPEAVGGLQQHNGPLVTVAMTLYEKLPGETVNGAFTHPAAVVNIIASTLEAMDKPLTDEQRRALERVGNEFVTEDGRRVQSYGDDTLALRRHADESLLKGRFYAAAMAVLTDEQHALLRPEATRGRVTADLFSAALVWVGRAKPIPFTSRAGLAERLGGQIGRELGLEDEARARVSRAISDWVADLPEDMMTREPDALWLKGIVPIDVIDVAAEHQIVLMERMISDLDLPADAVEDLRQHSGVFIPTWRPEQ